MRTYDFSPLYRSFVGFDRMASMIDTAALQAAKSSNSYPPYNVARLSEDNYRIELALAGFSAENIDIETHQGVLTITGHASQGADNDSISYLHRGIAERGFERSFQLADHVHITSAEFSDGLLIINLVREIPEALKPQKIAITRASSQPDKKLISEKSGKSKKAA